MPFNPEMGPQKQVPGSPETAGSPPRTRATMHIIIDIVHALGDLAEALNRNPFGAVMLAVLACIGIAAVKAIGVQ